MKNLIVLSCFLLAFLKVNSTENLISNLSNSNFGFSESKIFPLKMSQEEEKKKKKKRGRRKNKEVKENLIENKISIGEENQPVNQKKGKRKK
ncbi:MAG: hypothetical protein V4622_13055 [Bacteroidota bacterium]